MVGARTRYVIMIKYLMNKKTYVTSAALAKAAGVSVRTVKNDWKELSGLLTTYRIVMEAKRSCGYRLIVSGDSDIEGLSRLLRANLKRKKGEVFRYDFQRVIHIINRLLIGKPYYKAEELMDIFFISRSTLTQDLNRARTLLAKFRLEIDVNLRMGVGITGKELDKRLCIAEYFFRYDDKLQVMVQRTPDTGTEGWDRQREDIVQIVQEGCREGKIRLSPFLAVDLASHMYVSILRIKAGWRIEELPGEARPVNPSRERYAARHIADSLEVLYRIGISEYEREYFALHIMSKKIPDGAFTGSGEHTALKQCIMEITREIKDNFELDFAEDSLFLNFLYMNIEPMVLRLRTHLIVRNPLLFENLRRYLFATKVAHCASGIIEKIFGVEMDNNEFAYLVPAFNMMIGTHENRKKFKIGFCGDLGLPESLLYYNELWENLPKEGYELVWIDKIHNMGYVNQLRYLIYVNEFRLPAALPCYEIKDGDSIQEVCTAIAMFKLEQIQIDQYLKPEFGIFGLEGKNREEVMEGLYRCLEQRGLIASELGWEHAFRANEVGNGIAHIQDLGRIVKRAGCYVCVLKTPILWEQDMIKLMVMVKTKRDGDKNLSMLCRIVSNWTSSPERVERFLKAGSYEVFCEDITKECLNLCFHWDV